MMLVSGKLVRMVGLLALCGSMTGCLGLQLGTMKQGDMKWVEANTTGPRAGHAYLIRGFIGLFSYGIDRMTEKVAATGVEAAAHLHAQQSRDATKLPLERFSYPLEVVARFEAPQHDMADHPA